MFFGTTPSVISQYVARVIKEEKPKRVFVPFSGNFVFEQVAAMCDPKIKIHSTDISLYSRAIGYGLTNQESEIKLKEKWLKKYKGFKGKNSPEDIAVMVILFSEYAEIERKAEKGVRYYIELQKHAIATHSEAFSKMMDKFIVMKDKVAKNMTFYGTDGPAILKRLKPTDMILYDPPVLLGDYEKMFKSLEDCFEFEDQPYTVMDHDQKMSDLRMFTEKGAMAIYRTNNPTTAIPKGYKECFRHQYHYHKNYCLYSNIEDILIHNSRFSPLKEKTPNYPIIGDRDEIKRDSEITVFEMSGKESNHYRLLWVKKAEMSDAGRAYGIMIDGKLIGLIQLMSGLARSNHMALIMSDPAAPSSNYKRLSKLILYIGCSKQLLKDFNEKEMWEHDSFTTRVFSNEPVSMKYRGFFKLHERKVEPTGFFKYNIIYHKREGIPETYEEGLGWWWDKYGNQKIRPE